jgi:hypothetical protein
MHVRFDRRTGNITGIGSRTVPEQDSLAVALSEVRPLLEGTIPWTSRRVQYNTKTKEMALVNCNVTEMQGHYINDFLYELPEDDIEDPDLIVVQDVPNKCWKFFVGQSLRNNLKRSQINLTHTMMVSVTAKGDPNVLYKTLFVPLSSVLSDNYAVLPFSMPFEYTDENISVYTARRFDTYQFKRIINEQ